MSMIVESALPTRVELTYWDEQLSGRDDAYELVEGVPTMTPGESWFNRTVGTALATRLDTGGHDWVVGTDGEVTLFEVPPTVRRPDVVVARASSAVRDRPGLPANRLQVSEVLLVAEVVSPSSVERDLVTKRREYAAAGIPAYLVVDLRAEPGELTLYAVRGADGRYLDVDPSPQVEVTIGATTIRIAVTDLVR